MASRLFTRASSLCRPLSRLQLTYQFQSQFPKPRTYATKPMADSLISLAQSRRTIYQLGKSSSVPDAKIEELVNQAILHVPSAFNTQSTRLVLLLHDQHDRLWDIAIEAFEGLVASGRIPKEIWEKQTLPKLNGFKGAYGTVCGHDTSCLGIDTDRSRFFSSRTLRIFNPCRRSSRLIRISSCLGLSTRMPCTSTSVSCNPNQNFGAFSNVCSLDWSGGSWLRCELAALQPAH